MRTQFVEARHTDIHVTSHGTSGLPLIALHGWWCDHRLMTATLEPSLRYTSQLRHYIDLPGHGRSLIGTASTQEHVERVVTEVCKRLAGTGPALLVGMSYGGYLAQRVADAIPDRIAGLALIVPAVILPRDHRNTPEHHVVVHSEEPLHGESDHLADFSRLATHVTPTMFDLYTTHVTPGVELASHNKDALDAIEQTWASAPTDLPSTVGTYRHKPALWFVGRNDSSVGHQDQEALADSYTHATVATVDEAGHLAPFEKSEVFAALFTDWLHRASMQ